MLAVKKQTKFRKTKSYLTARKQRKLQFVSKKPTIHIESHIEKIVNEPHR